MKDAKRQNAIKKLNEEINRYTRELEELLMMEADVTLKNANYIPANASRYINLKVMREDIESLMITIGDLKAVQLALKKRKNSVFIKGSKNCPGIICAKTCKALSAAELTYDGEGFTGEIWFDKWYFSYPLPHATYEAAGLPFLCFLVLT